jgi:glycosyltransferase involved in cell wall biosynthesis
MNPAFVSVVIPTYNYGHFVVEAVESVLAQTYRDLEIIVVDDGSTDDTRKRLEPFMDRIRYIHQQNQGLSTARNAGIHAAKGEWIAFLDSDDLWHPRKLEVQMPYLAEHPDVALLATDSVTDLSGGWPEIAVDFDPPAERIRLEDIVICSQFGVCSVVVRRECFEKSGLFDTELRSAEDRDMWIRIACHYPVAKLQVPLWWYRKHISSMSFVADRMITNQRKVLQKTFARDRLFSRNLLFRLQAFSYFHRSSAYTYDAAGKHVRAAAQIVWSIAMWPFPFSPRFCRTPLERPKKLLVILLRMLGLKQPETVPR